MKLLKYLTIIFTLFSCTKEINIENYVQVEAELAQSLYSRIDFIVDSTEMTPLTPDGKWEPLRVHLKRKIKKIRNSHVLINVLKELNKVELIKKNNVFFYSELDNFNGSFTYGFLYYNNKLYKYKCNIKTAKVQLLKHKDNYFTGYENIDDAVLLKKKDMHYRNYELDLMGVFCSNYLIFNIRKFQTVISEYNIFMEDEVNKDFKVN